MPGDWDFGGEESTTSKPVHEVDESLATEQLQELLFGGEHLETAVMVNNVAVGVTTHRVLAYDPGSTGIQLQSVFRPNVTEVTTRTEGTRNYAVGAARFGSYGLILGAVGLLMDLGSIIDPIDAPAGLGIGEAITLLNAFIGILGYLDDLFVLVGTVLIVIGLTYAALFVTSRSKLLIIEVAGDDSIQIPLTHDVPSKQEQLTQAVEKTSNPTDG